MHQVAGFDWELWRTAEIDKKSTCSNEAAAYLTWNHDHVTPVRYYDKLWPCSCSCSATKYTVSCASQLSFAFTWQILTIFAWQSEMCHSLLHFTQSDPVDLCCQSSANRAWLTFALVITLYSPCFLPEFCQQDFQVQDLVNLWITTSLMIYKGEYFCGLFCLWVRAYRNRLVFNKDHSLIKTMFCVLHLDPVSSHDNKMVLVPIDIWHPQTLIKTTLIWRKKNRFEYFSHCTNYTTRLPHMWPHINAFNSKEIILIKGSCN